MKRTACVFAVVFYILTTVDMFAALETKRVYYVKGTDGSVARGRVLKLTRIHQDTVFLSLRVTHLAIGSRVWYASVDIRNFSLNPRRVIKHEIVRCVRYYSRQKRYSRVRPFCRQPVFRVLHFSTLVFAHGYALYRIKVKYGARLFHGPFFIQQFWSENYARQRDKLGHGFGALSTTRISSQFWKTYYTDPADWRPPLFGAFFGFLVTGIIELNDGFQGRDPIEIDIAQNNGWGFSLGDEGAHVLFTGIGYLFERYPVIEDYVTLKFFLEHGYDFKRLENLRPNYDAQVYWLVFKSKKLLPKPFNVFNIAIGTSTENNQTRPEYKVALDIDLTRILPGFFGKVVNFIHLPFPEASYVAQ